MIPCVVCKGWRDEEPRPARYLVRRRNEEEIVRMCREHATEVFERGDLAFCMQLTSPTEER